MDADEKLDDRDTWDAVWERPRLDDVDHDEGTFPFEYPLDGIWSVDDDR